jgi:PAS domain S-box-containing protein
MTIAGLCAQALERARLSAAERAALDAADEALAMLDTVVDSAPIGLAYLDTELRYRRINPRLAAMNGLSVAEHLGRRPRDLFPQMAPAWEPHWQRVLATAEPVAGLVFSALRGDGRIGHAQVSFYPVRVGDGPVLGVGVLVLDVTQQKEAEEERARLLASEQAARAAAQEAQARAEAALQLREAFLSIAAHELKTPLTSLLGQAQLLERRLANEGLLTDQNARSLQVVVGQARRLSHLIGDLLDGANLELGQLAIRRLPVELGRLVRKVVEELQPTSPGHQLSVRVLDGPVTVQADPIRMEQVIQNLLGNAVKYSPRGSEVAVEVRCVDGEALVSVRDRGVGIPADAMPRLFERFYRVASAETSSVSGVGVGLYVVREIVRLHNGEVRVESTPGEGSTFTVALPIAG